MSRVFSLAKQVDVGDEIRWSGEKSKVENPKPRTVTEVFQTKMAVVVMAEGPGDGEAGFCVDESDDSRAWYGPQKKDMGSVEFVELVEEDIIARPT